MKKDYISEINNLKIKKEQDLKMNFKNKKELVNYLCGYRSFIISFIKNGDNKVKNMVNKVKQIETLINVLGG